MNKMQITNPGEYARWMPTKLQDDLSKATEIDWQRAKEKAGKEGVVLVKSYTEGNTDQAVIDAFHKLWYPHQQVWWMGHEMQKCPMDLLMYQEILYECKPDLVIECGTWRGGSALYMAHLCDLMAHGNVLTIDVNQFAGFPQHPRIMYLTGSSVDKATIQHVKAITDGFRKIMVVLDSDHTREHVLKELELYSPLVTPGQYLIVEDSNIHGHPVRDDLPAGPFEAVQKWLPKNEGFVQDKACERYLLTFNPGGYLRKIGGGK